MVKNARAYPGLGVDVAPVAAVASAGGVLLTEVLEGSSPIWWGVRRGGG